MSQILASGWACWSWYWVSRTRYCLSAGRFLASRSRFRVSGVNFLPLELDFWASGSRFLASGGRIWVSGSRSRASRSQFWASGIDFLYLGFNVGHVEVDFLPSGDDFILGVEFKLLCFNFIHVGVDFGPLPWKVFECAAERRLSWVVAKPSLRRTLEHFSW